jgi:hypothetical protein
MTYEYFMVQVPPTIQVKQKEFVGNEAAYFLQTAANQYATQGWEFYRVDTVGVVVQPGCLAALIGQKQTLIDYFVITFRRPK